MQATNKKQSFITIFALMELFICFVFAFWYFFRSSQLVEEVAKGKLSLAHSIIEHKISQTDSYLSASLDFIGRYINKHATHNNQEIRELLMLYSEHKKIKELVPFYEMAWLDKNGAHIVSTLDSKKTYELINNPEVASLGSKCRNSPQTLKYGKRIFFEKNLSMFCYGVNKNDNAYSGTVIAGIDQHAFERYLQQLIGDNTISFVIYNRSLELIYESTDNYLSNKYGNKLKGLFSNNAAIQDRYIKLSTFHFFSPEIIYIYNNPYNGLIFALTTNNNFSAALLTEKLVPLTTDLIFLLLIGITITFFVYRKLIQPVLSLSNRAQRIATGNTDIAHEEFSYIELDSLSKAIVKVAEQQKLSEENKKLHFLVQKVEEANFAKTEFIRHIQHEFRTPLNHIIGSTEIISSGMIGPLTDDLLCYIDSINKSGRTLLDAINNVIYLADYLSGKVKLKEEICSLKKILSDILDKFTNKLQEKNIILEQEIQVALPLILIDRIQFSEAIGFILDNAIKFNKTNGTVYIETYKSEDGAITLRIEDTGIGIEKNYLTKITNMFNDSSSDIAKLNKGVGLGLSVADCILSLHDMKLDIESTPDVGTCVTITIPAARAKEI